MPSDPTQRDDDDDGALAVKRERKTEKARRYRVVFHNDDYTQKWFVVMVLMKFFHMEEATANTLMMAVHREGHGVAGVYTRDIAESKVEQVLDLAREYEMPLRLTAEPE